MGVTSLKRSLVLLLLLICSTSIQAADIIILGLFKDKAVIERDGQPFVLRVGQQLAPDIILLSSNSQRAIFDIYGEKKEFKLGSHIQSEFRQAKQKIVKILRDPQGMYRIKGTINSMDVSFLVDTGATLVAINSLTAELLGIDYEKSGRETKVETASGQAKAFFVTLDRLTVQGITQHNVSAVIVEGDSPKEVLLGMSFLRELDMQNKTDVLELRQKY